MTTRRSPPTQRAQQAQRGQPFERLIAGAIRGEPAAQAALHARYVSQVRRRVARWARGSLRTTVDTSDLAQSVFADLLRDLPTFQSQGERAFRAWLLTKADWKVRSKHRRRVDRSGSPREVPLAEPDAHRGHDQDPARIHLQSEAGTELTAALSALPPERRLILTLRNGQGMDFAAIARLLDLPSSDAARMRHARALAALREALDPAPLA